MQQNFNPSRRDFLKSSGAAGGALVIGFVMPGMVQRAIAQTASQTPKVYPPNAFIAIGTDSRVSIVVNHCEMGQGIFTSMSQLIAEELGCDWQKITAVAPPVAPVYDHLMFGPMQATGGSTSLTSTYEQYRKIGATARAMLMEAAAKKWGVSPTTLKTEDGFVIHAEKGRLAYGELAEAAKKVEMPKDVCLKSAGDFKFIGKPMPRLDARAKSTGQAIYGIDVRLPKMVHVVVLRPPVFGGSLKSFNATDAKKVPGVVDVVRVGDKVAVLGRNSYAARKGRDLLRADWDLKGKDQLSSASIMAQFKKDAENPAFVVKSNPDAVKMTTAAKHALDAEYEFPYLAHAAMEPLNVTVDYDGKKADIWSGHQMPTMDRNYAAQIFGLPNDQVKINSVYAGGSFGRRGSKDSDYVREACEIAKIVKRPMQLLYTREDDMKAGYYRPMAYHRARVTLDPKDGRPEAWHHTIVTPSIMAGSPFAAMMGGGADPTATEGVTDTLYDLQRMHIDLRMPLLDIPTSWFRSVGHTHTGFVMETMIDELAHRAKKDPLKYRQQLLAKSSRHLAVLDLLKSKSPYGRPAPKGHAYGLAVHESFNSVVGHVVEVSIHEGRPKLHHVWSAVHCGRVVNPEGARTQIEGAIAFALTMALYGNIAIEKGEVTTTNYHNYRMVRSDEMPKVEVSFVASEDKPTGLGEPGVPPLAPALANAIFKLSGKRLRRLPLSLKA